MSEEQDKTRAPEARRPAVDVTKVRAYAARAVWLICLAIALVLAAAAFSYALNANADNSLIHSIRNLAKATDLGWFDLNQPIWKAKPPNALTKTALANYGVASVVYMVIGRTLERIIRP
ncbi:hypothetical protein [Nocardioides montaniterrae]